MRKRITIEKGEVKIEVLDGVGTSCRQDTQPYRDMLAERFGINPDDIKEELRPEFHQAPATESQQEGQTLV